VSISKHHRLTGVAKDHLKVMQRPAIHHEVTREGVPAIVYSNRPDAGLLQV
jgi:hypothetical protein